MGGGSIPIPNFKGSDFLHIVYVYLALKDSRVPPPLQEANFPHLAFLCSCAEGSGLGGFRMRAALPLPALRFREQRFYLLQCIFDPPIFLNIAKLWLALHLGHSPSSQTTKIAHICAKFSPNYMPFAVDSNGFEGASGINFVFSDVNVWMLHVFCIPTL